VGISTIDRLAAASPEVVAAIVGGITRGGATAMIDSARGLADEGSPVAPTG
jgi:hypothetical protein